MHKSDVRGSMNSQKVKIPNQSPSIPRDGTSECWFLFVALLEICSPPWICGLILKSCSQTLKKKSITSASFLPFSLPKLQSHVMLALPTLSSVSLSFLFFRLSMCLSCWAAFWRTSSGLASRSWTVSLALIHRHRDSNCYDSFYFQNITLVFWQTDSYFQACLLVFISFSNI